MSITRWIACLESYPRPSHIESWVLDSAPALAPDDVPEAYRQAVEDLLTGLGVLRDGAFTSTHAYLFARSLANALRDDALRPAMWRDHPDEPCTGTGASLLELLENHRMECVEAPTPMRRVAVVVAVIKTRLKDGDAYLMQYDENAKQFQPIGGKREPDETDNRLALLREVREELQNDRIELGRDFTMRPLAENADQRTISATLHVMTEYQHSFYLLENVRFALEIDRLTRWITREEMLAGKTADGKPVSGLLWTHLAAQLDQLPYSL